MNRTPLQTIQGQRSTCGRGVIRARLLERPPRMARPLGSTDDDRIPSLSAISRIGEAVTLRFGTKPDTAEVLDVETTAADGDDTYEGVLRRSTRRGEGGDLRFQKGAKIRFRERHIFSVRRRSFCSLCGI